MDDIVPRQGLPLRPGREMDDAVAEGLIGKDGIANLQGHPLGQKDAVLTEQRDSGLPQPGITPAVETPPEFKEGAEEGEDSKARSEPCKRCGLNPDDPFLVEPTSLDKVNFMRAALTGGRFEKSFPLFGGRLRVTFRSRIVDESESISRHLQWQAVQGNLDIRFLYTLAQKMTMSMSLSKVEVFDEQGIVESSVVYPIPTLEFYPEIEGEGSQQLCDRVHYKLFIKNNVSEMTYNALYKAFLSFDALYQMLISRAEDSDFWLATPSAT